MRKLIAFVLGIFNSLIFTAQAEKKGGTGRAGGAVFALASLLVFLFSAPSMAGNVPNGYTELEYVNMNSRSYLTTGVVPTSDMHIEIDFQTTTVSGSAVGYFEARTTGTTIGNGLALIHDSAKAAMFDGFAGSRWKSSYTMANNTRYKYVWNNGNVQLRTGGSAVVNHDFTPSSTATSPIVLNASLQQSGEAVANVESIYVYSFKVWNAQGNLVANYIPAKYGNTVGFYDTVGGGSLKTATSGNFTAGKELDGCRNLFDSSVFNTNVGPTITYKTYSIPNGKYTMSTNFPRVGYATNVFVFEGEVTSGAATDTNGVFDTAPRTITVTDGKYTIAYRSTEGSNTHNPKDYNWQLESGDTATNYVPYSAACHPTSCKNLVGPDNYGTDVELGENNTLRNKRADSRGTTLNFMIMFIPNGGGYSVVLNKPITTTGKYNYSFTVPNNIGDSDILYAKHNGNQSDLGLLSGLQRILSAGKTYTISFEAVSVDPATVGGIQLKDIQIEAGSSATAYTPYSASCGTCTGNLATYDSATGTVVQNGTPTPTNPIEPIFYTQGKITLRRVGDVADSYDASTGKITRRVGVKVLNGTEDWGYNSNKYFSIAGARNAWGYVKNTAGLATIFPIFIDATAFLASDNGFMLADGFNIRPKGFAFTVEGLAQFQQYLAQQAANGTPVTVWYPLATATEETVGKTWCETAIKIATTKYNTNAFSGVVTALSNAVDTIKTVVANTINQATAVANLHSGKQTKPTDTCPNGKICLLVEDESGTPHWYEIIERAPGIVPAGSGYTQVEYLQSDGNQYIDTGVTGCGTGTTVEAKFSLNSMSSPWNSVYGATTDFAFTTNPTLQQNSYQYSGWSDVSAVVDTNVHTVRQANENFYIDGNFVYSRPQVTFSSSKKMLVFSRTAGDTTYTMRGKIYYFKMWKNDTMVADFVPARRNSDGVLGMYDTVSGNFFTNAGSGKFYAPDQWVPNTYTRLEYIESTGTQYIDTGVKPDSNYSYELKFSGYTVPTSGSSEHIMFGETPQSWNELIGVNQSKAGSRSNVVPYIKYDGVACSLAQQTAGTFLLNSSGLSFNGNLVYQRTPSSFGTETYPIYLFAVNYKGTASSSAGSVVSSLTQYRLENFKVWNNGTPVREFVPVRRNSDNELGMYDCVNGVFYDNDGSGDFLAPVQ